VGAGGSFSLSIGMVCVHGTILIGGGAGIACFGGGLEGGKYCPRALVSYIRCLEFLMVWRCVG